MNNNNNDYNYADVLALEFFKQVITNYHEPHIEPDLFAMLLRYLEDETVLFEPMEALTQEEDSANNGRRRHSTDDLDTEAKCSLLWRRPSMREKFRQHLLAVIEELLVPIRKQTESDPMHARIAELQTTLHLTDDELAVVLVMWLVNTQRLDMVRYNQGMYGLIWFLNLCTGLSAQTIRAMFRNSARLCRFGVVSSREHSELTSRIRYFLEGSSDEPLASSFYRKDTTEVLPMAFFGDLAKKHVPILKKLLSNRSEHGLNILLYGAPGTGKTSFARALASEVGRTCYQIEQRPKDSDGEYRAAKAEIRYAAIEICNEQVVPEDSFIVVDEADRLLRCTNMGIFEMFGRSSSVTGDKGLLNDILEKNKVPTIWITNTESNELDMSNRRRFDYSIRFDPLSKGQRIDIWRNAAVKAGIAKLLRKKDIVTLVERYPVNIGIVARAFENAANLGGDRKGRLEMIEALLDRQCELSGWDNTGCESPRVATDYSLEGLNIKSKIGLDKVVGAAKRFLSSNARGQDRDAPRMNILLSGVPGSGKTEFVKYLANQMGCPLLMRKPSDLKSKWVGETEQNIAAAFQEAKKKKAVLFFDELDSFLDNREALGQGHEKSMVNEVLQQMEGFGGVFIGATNHAGMLDPAVARRFTFKIEMDYLTSSGKRLFFKRFFESDLSAEDEARLDEIDCLTPGDFRTVRQELYYLGDEVDNSDRINALEEEVRAKSIGKCAKVGF